jgi:CRISPR-associated protein Csm3
MKIMKLLTKLKLTGTLKTETGLHIGGSKTSLDIGGLDSPVIKTPLGVPYIPGSSLKGKLRTLLAKKHNTINDKQDEHGDTELIKKVFGYAGIGEASPGNPTRLIVRDAFLDEERFKKTFAKVLSDMETEYTEAKFENRINRQSGTAQHPRQIERVPPEAIFKLELVLDVYHEDNQQAMLALLKEGFDLLHHDYLGGSGSRGYGKVFVKFDADTEKIFHAIQPA